MHYPHLKAHEATDSVRRVRSSTSTLNVLSDVNVVTALFEDVAVTIQEVEVGFLQALAEWISAPSMEL
jgi:glutamate 5-kinase